MEPGRPLVMVNSAPDLCRPQVLGIKQKDYDVCLSMQVMIWFRFDPSLLWGISGCIAESRLERGEAPKLCILWADFVKGRLACQGPLNLYCSWRSVAMWVCVGGLWESHGCTLHSRPFCSEISWSIDASFAYATAKLAGCDRGMIWRLAGWVDSHDG